MAASYQTANLVTGGSTNASFPSAAGYGLDPSSPVLACQINVTTAGVTCTYTAQGSIDGTNWYNLAYLTDATDTVAVAPLVYTTTGARIIFLSLPHVRRYRYFRVTTSAINGQVFNIDLFNVNPG